MFHFFPLSTCFWLNYLACMLFQSGTSVFIRMFTAWWGLLILCVICPYPRVMKGIAFYRWSILCCVFKQGNRYMKKLPSPDRINEPMVFLCVSCQKFCGMVTSQLLAKIRFLLFSFVCMGHMRCFFSPRLWSQKPCFWNNTYSTQKAFLSIFLLSLRLTSNYRIATIYAFVSLYGTHPSVKRYLWAEAN